MSAKLQEVVTVASNYDKVKEFRDRFNAKPNFSLGFELIKEEFDEVDEQVQWGTPETTPSLVKELVDLLYVTYSALADLGVNVDKAFAEVHRSNMSKLGEDGKPIYREDGKVLKGPNYSPANLKDLV